MSKYFYTLDTSDFSNAIREFPKEVARIVAQELEESAQKVRSEAVSRAQDRLPGEFDHFSSEQRKDQASRDLVNIAQSITADKNNDLSWEVVASSPLSAYFEFGTGAYVFDGESWADAELREYARTFYVNGKGITKPHPFLFNSFYEERVKLIERIKNRLGIP